MMQLTLPNESHIPAIKEMVVKFFHNSPYAKLGMDHFKTDLLIDHFVNHRDPNQLLIISLTEEGKPVGIFAGHINEPLFNKTLVASEILVWVEEEGRNAGVFQDLLGAFEYWAAKCGCKLIQMQSLEGVFKDVLHEMYTKNGYTPCEYSYVKEL